MTVSELIAALSNLPGELPVLLVDRNESPYSSDSLALCRCVRDWLPMYPRHGPDEQEDVIQIHVDCVFSYPDQ